jgi:hypothetical protein
MTADLEPGLVASIVQQSARGGVDIRDDDDHDALTRNGYSNRDTRAEIIGTGSLYIRGTAIY